MLWKTPSREKQEKKDYSSLEVLLWPARNLSFWEISWEATPERLTKESGRTTALEIKGRPRRLAITFKECRKRKKKGTKKTSIHFHVYLCNKDLSVVHPPTISVAEFQFGSVRFWEKRKVGVPRERPLRARERNSTNSTQISNLFRESFQVTLKWRCRRANALTSPPRYFRRGSCST